MVAPCGGLVPVLLKVCFDVQSVALCGVGVNGVLLWRLLVDLFVALGKGHIWAIYMSIFVGECK